MTNPMLARAGALAFALWGTLHAAGGAAILAALAEGPGAAFALYRGAGAETALAGAILGYLGFLMLAAGLAALTIAIRGNWRNSETALLANTLVVLTAEAGLVAFLLVPGYLGLAEAAPGLVLAALGIVPGGVACRAKEAAHAAG